ncbi:MAG: TIGR01777 family oxidoreductase [Chloroflexota bacterium]
MRVIIAGGTGLIGRPLAKLFKNHGYEVIVLTRSPHKHDLSAGVKLHEWDAETADGWGHLIHKNTALINLAGENPAASVWTEEHKERVLQSRLKAVGAMVDAVQSAHEKPSVLLQASAVGYYGNKGDTILTEHSPHGHNWRADVCVHWENAAKPIEDMGVRVCYMRIGIVLDKNGGALPSFIQAAKLLGRRLGDGEQWLPWVHNTEISHMMRHLMLKETAHGAYNLVAHEPVTNTVFMQTLADVMGRPALLPVPQFALKLALGEMATTVLDSQRVVPQRFIEEGYEFQFTDLHKALADVMQ